jgi:hypothetical protein
MPDHLQVWPGHGRARRAARPRAPCRSPRSAMRAFQLGFRFTKSGIRLAGSSGPDPTALFRREMKRLNKLGPQFCGSPSGEAAGNPLRPLLRDGALVVDLRTAPTTPAAHPVPSISRSIAASPDGPGGCSRMTATSISSSTKHHCGCGRRGRDLSIGLDLDRRLFRQRSLWSLKGDRGSVGDSSPG